MNYISKTFFTGLKLLLLRISVHTTHRLSSDYLDLTWLPKGKEKSFSFTVSTIV